MRQAHILWVYYHHVTRMWKENGKDGQGVFLTGPPLHSLSFVQEVLLNPISKNEFHILPPMTEQVLKLAPLVEKF